MRCGTKCFIVTMEKDDGKQTYEIPARSAADARKISRRRYGDGLIIHSVHKK
ncbi:hypothetical protein [Lacicoccus alkaliphilus]|uniref:Uncharacterized protein n=1 Tax=Lacicoccus alkaliphilus DSM 16010 TaxID=1123231 RepID=A0A1M7JSJ1_9BACL|nr:hypothetical protein [Salinicoccus alkaliphilus]SHM56060.1 hypothetical protein SAMN02745189_02369 [Salinicoccus alkaliphilus DSM 16010]